MLRGGGDGRCHSLGPAGGRVLLPAWRLHRWGAFFRSLPVLAFAVAARMSSSAALMGQSCSANAKVSRMSCAMYALPIVDAGSATARAASVPGSCPLPVGGTHGLLHPFLSLYVASLSMCSVG